MTCGCGLYHSRLQPLPTRLQPLPYTVAASRAHLDRRVELLDRGGDPGEERAAAHREEDGVERRTRRRPLTVGGRWGEVGGGERLAVGGGRVCVAVRWAERWVVRCGRVIRQARVGGWFGSWVLYLPISPCISLYLPISPDISSVGGSARGCAEFSASIPSLPAGVRRRWTSAAVGSQYPPSPG